METTETISFCCLLGQLVKAPLFVLLFLFSESRIVSHSPFPCKRQNRCWDIKPVVAHFPSKKCGTSDIRIPHNSLELHPAPCISDVRHVRGLVPSRTSKQNVLSLFLLILLAKLMNKNMGICRHRILYPLRLGPPFLNDAQIPRRKASLEPNQMLN